MKWMLALLSLLCVLDGNTQSRRLLIAPPRSSSSFTLTVDFWQDFEFASISTGNLAAQDHNTGGTWAVSDGSSRLSTSASGQQTMPSTITSSGTLYTDSGTLGLKSDITTGHAEARSVYYTPASSPGSAAVSVGFWFYFGTMANSISGGNIFSTTGAGGSELVGIQVKTDISGNHSMFLQGTGTAATGTLTANTWYWLTLLSVQNTTCKMRVYDTTGALVGSELTVTGNNQASHFFVIGSFNTYGALNATFYYDNVVIDYTTAAFPLKPWP